MAIIFELWIECENRKQAEKHISHFDGLAFTLLSGLEISWKSGIDAMCPETPGVEVWSSELSSFGVRDVQDAIDITECGIRLYHHLLSAPEFQFAYTAFNPNVCVAELGDYFSRSPDGYRSCQFSCVLNDELAQKFAPLRFFQPFRPGYLWREYLGEDYRPLGSNDHPELSRLKRQLLSA